MCCVTVSMSPSECCIHMPTCRPAVTPVHSVRQKSIGLQFSKSRTGSDVRYSCHHNSNPPFTVRNNPLPAAAGCQFGCKASYPSRLHITVLSVSPDTSCLRQAATALQSVTVPSYTHVFPFCSSQPRNVRFTHFFRCVPKLFPIIV